MSNFVAQIRDTMNKVRITAMRQAAYPDLMEKFERSAQRDALLAKNPIEHACDVVEGQQWIWPSLPPSRLGNSSELDCSRCSVGSIDWKQPEGMCPAAWYSMRDKVNLSQY